MKIWRLRIGKRECSDGQTFSLASWAYVSGYWLWVLIWYPKLTVRQIASDRARFGTLFSKPIIYNKGPRTFSIWVNIGVGGLYFTTQPKLDAMKYRFDEQGA